MDTKRLILFVIFSFSLLLLWDSWQKKQGNYENVIESSNLDQSIPSLDTPLSGANDSMDLNSYQLGEGQDISIKTDNYDLKISEVGGDIREIRLLKHFDDADQPYLLMSDRTNPLFYVFQSGFSGKSLPSHKVNYQFEQTNYEMQGDSLSVPLIYETADLKVVKTYTFKKGSYEIQVSNQVTNKTNGDLNPKIYYQFLHDGTSNQGSVMMPTFTGAAYFTKDQNFNKLGFSDIKDETLSLTSNDGWISIIQRYFASAIILPDSVARKFYANKVADNIYSAGVISQLGNISPGQSKEFSVNIFSGPQLKDDLISAADGLEYVVDYGWLTFIASPLFSVMSGIHSMVGNWGIAIILLTLLIKLLFYPLSASSYRSMAQMRELAPRLQSMKEKFGEDKQKMQQAMMELYRTEKINPLGGCLPILIQIPVFIALYWVLLGAVELRQAPFFGWIEDLSIKDPYYVLPILMAASMFLQTKLNPKPTDPMQARLMIMMPIIFSVFFFFFPAGLVLYWLANNILSIAQQWYVNKKIHAEALKKKGNG